jgi:hypothetical protein
MAEAWKESPNYHSIKRIFGHGELKLRINTHNKIPGTVEFRLGAPGYDDVVICLSDEELVELFQWRLKTNLTQQLKRSA